MARIPVGATIAHAYRFLFREFFAILGVMWVGAAVTALGVGLLVSKMMALSLAIATHNPAWLGHALPVLVPFYLLALVLLFMQVTGIAELALGQKTGPRWYYVSLGRPVWRLAGSVLLLALAMLGAWIGLLLTVMLAGLAIRGLETAHLLTLAQGMGVAVGIVLVLWCACIYAVIRLSFFLVPVAIAEKRISLWRSWQLGRGNFWRIVAVLLAVLLPVFALEVAFVFGFLAHGLPPIAPPHATPRQIEVARLGMGAWDAVILARTVRYWYLSFPASLLLGVLFYGLGCGAQCFAYRAVTADDAANASRP